MLGDLRTLRLFLNFESDNQILLKIVVEISRKPSSNKVTQLFLDPTGRHIIVTTCNGENYYLFHKWRRTKELAKLKVCISNEKHCYISTNEYPF